MNRYGDYLVHDDAALIADRLEELTAAIRALRAEPDESLQEEPAKPDGIWVVSGTNVTPEECDKVRPILEEALAKGEKSVVSGGRLWVYHQT